MKKLFIILALFTCFKAFGQTPTNPTPVNQMTWYKDFTGHMWAYRGATLGWVQMVDFSQLGTVTFLPKANSGLHITADSTIRLGGSLLEDIDITGGNHYFQTNNSFSSNATDSFVRTFLLNNEIGSLSIGTFISSNYGDGLGSISSTGSVNTWNFGSQLLAAFTDNDNSINDKQSITVGKVDGNIPTFSGSKIEIYDGLHLKGAQYSADYSAVGKLDNRWIPDWGAVKSLFPGSGFVPYIGATEDLQLDTVNLSFHDGDIVNEGANIAFRAKQRNGFFFKDDEDDLLLSLNGSVTGADDPTAVFYTPLDLRNNIGAPTSPSYSILVREDSVGTYDHGRTAIVPASTFATAAGYVPYSGATTNLNLGDRTNTSGAQFVLPSSGQPITTYKNAIYPVKSFIGMQGSPEANFSFNMDYNLPGLTGIHQYGGDPTLGAIWYAAGGTRGWAMQYAPANITNTGVNALTFTGGSGYTDGSYAVSATGGSGTGEILNITVSGGIVTACTAGHVGDNYVIGDVLGASGIGAGSGFSATVVSLIADIWYKSGQKMFLRGDILTNTLTLGATGASTPVVGAGVQVERTLGVASMSGTTASNGFILNGSPLVLTAAPVYLNHDNTGTVFIAGGNGAVQFGSINTIAANVKYNFLGSQSATTSASGHKFGVSLVPTANGQILTEAQFTPTFSAGTGALTATITTAATALADGTYDNLASTATTGSGSGQTWRVTVLGGVVTAIVPATAATGGTGYAVGNTFTVNTVTGAVFTVATLGYTGSILTSAQFNGAPIQFATLGNPTNPADGMFYFTGTSLRLRASSATNVISMSSTVGSNTQVPIYNSSGILVPTTPTGTGNPVLQTSPTLTTPNLGTPSAAVLTNATGLPTAGLVNNAVTYAKMQAMTTGRLLGSGTGTAVAEITPAVQSGTGETLVYGASTITHGNDTTVIRTAANSYSLSAMQTKLNNYGLLSGNQNWTGNNTFGLEVVGTSGFITRGNNPIKFYNTGNTFFGNLFPNSLTSNQVWNLPNKSGDVALTTDIPTASHAIFTPTTGGTVTLTNNAYNIINPAGALATLTVTLPSSPANNNTVFIKYTQAVTAVTYNGGTVVDGITSPVAGGLVVLVYDSGTSSWY